MKHVKPRQATPKAETPPLPLTATAAAVPAWEQIEVGRYQPRRIRGSYRGRELG